MHHLMAKETAEVADEARDGRRPAPKLTNPDGVSVEPEHLHRRQMCDEVFVVEELALEGRRHTESPSLRHLNPIGFQSRNYAAFPQHFLYFLPLPHGQASLRPTRGPSRVTGF